jgi:putative ABC transport system substrate-binding protein
MMPDPVMNLGIQTEDLMAIVARAGLAELTTLIFAYAMAAPAAAFEVPRTEIPAIHVQTPHVTIPPPNVRLTLPSVNSLTDPVKDGLVASLAIDIKRRELITALGGAAFAWSHTARAQQPAMPVIGILSGANLGGPTLEALQQGIKEAGFIEGQNVAIERRDADGHYNLLLGMADELVRRQVAVILAIGGGQAVVAAKAATSVIPIVFSNGGDPVKLGFVASLNRPGGNVTGVSFLTNTLGAKRMQLLHTLVPAAVAIGVLANPQNPSDASETADMAAARALGETVSILTASSEAEIDAAFVKFSEQRVSALSIVADGFFNSRRERLAALEVRYSFPAIFAERLFAVAGGLMSYGASVTDANRFAGLYAGRILKGEKPADLPVIQSTKIELVINLKTAKALGLTVPPTLLATADEVIE